MRLRHTLFNIVGVTLALIFVISGCGQLSGGGRMSHLAWTVLVVLLVGGGSIANLSERRLARWPTIAMIVGYVASILLLPFGIWGVIELVLERNRLRRRR